jgi:hypothetical protein
MPITRLPCSVGVTRRALGAHVQLDSSGTEPGWTIHNRSFALDWKWGCTTIGTFPENIYTKGGIKVTDKPIVIMPIAAALAALGGLDPAAATIPQPDQKTQQAHQVENGPSALSKDDLLGLTVSRQTDGTVMVAQSHGSHGSHVSSHHYSHLSGGR